MEVRGFHPDTVNIIRKQFASKMNFSSKLLQENTFISLVENGKAKLKLHIVYMFGKNNGFSTFDANKYIKLFYVEDLYTGDTIKTTLMATYSDSFSIIEEETDEIFYKDLKNNLSAFNIKTFPVMLQEVKNTCKNNIVITPKSKRFNNNLHILIINSFVSKSLQYNYNKTDFNILDGNKPLEKQKQEGDRFDMLDYKLEDIGRYYLLKIKSNEEYILAEDVYHTYDKNSKNFTLKLDKKRIKNKDFTELFYKICSISSIILNSNF